MSRLLDAAGDARILFVVGKGGVGKTTAAGALAVASADAAVRTHLISTDPAHSLADLFDTHLDDTLCGDLLTVEELDAEARAAEWLAHALGPVAQLVESGTLLDAEDVAAFSRLALPGVDELMAMLRLTELVGEDARVIVDTAPTGHTLRLLDAAGTLDSLADALRAMADKARAVASALVGAAVEVRGESIIAELDAQVKRYREEVLGRAAFLVAARADPVVEAETDRLIRELERRELSVAGVVWLDSIGAAGRAFPRFTVPRLPDPRGCGGLRAWNAAVAPAAECVRGATGPAPAAAVTGARSFAAWLEANAPPLLLVAGKGGVGKTTCAAATALVLAQSRDVLLCSADPAGSLDDVLAGQVARVRTLQIDPSAEMARLRRAYGADLDAALQHIGLAASAELDRRVIESLWELTPPGIDEIAAMITMLDAAESDEQVVLDAAPTGHFLRMIRMPEVALDWTRQLMRIVVKYGLSGVAGDAAESLLHLSRDLKTLVARLRDPQRTGALIVTLDEPLVGAETRRLHAALQDAGIRTTAVIVNRADSAAAFDAGVTTAISPAHPSPIGAAALRDLAATWKIVT